MSEPGKTARNELRKIQATFWNNLAVACAVAGVVGPYLSLFNVTGGRPWFMPLEGWTRMQSLAVTGIAMAAIAAIGAAVVFHRTAKRYLSAIED